MDDRHDEADGHDAEDASVDGGETASDAIDDLDALAPGVLIAERYEVAQLVSAGSNTVIVDAIDRRGPDGGGHPVTVKIVRPHLAERPDFMHKFRVLADLSQALTHPNISSVLDWGEVRIGPAEAPEPSVFWAVDAFGGGSLRDLLDRGRTLTPGQALVVGLEACRALDAAHQRGLFHTELTPSKMVFGADRRLRIVDFGIARLLAESVWENPASVPTHVARYASPEQAIGVPIDAKTDVYALALVLVEAVTGEVPFAADSTVATLAGRVDRLLPVSADLGALAAILERAARPEATDRYTAAEFGRALVSVASKLPRPEPIPVLSTGMFDTTASAMRRPTDPTGGVGRPDGDNGGTADTPDEAAEVPAADRTTTEDAAVAGAAAVAAGVAAAGAGVSVPTGETVTETQSGLDAEHPPGSPDEPGAESPSATAAGSPSGTAAESPSAAAGSLSGTAAMSSGDGEVSSSATGDVGDAAAAESSPDVEDASAGTATVVDTPVVPVDPSGGDDLRFTEELLDDAPAASTTVSMPAAVVQPMPAETPAAEVFDDAPAKRRKGPLVLAAIVLIAGLGALGYAATLLFQPNSFAVPVLAGQPVERALNQIAGNGWEVGYEFERSDSFPDPEQVIRTVPEPGIELEEGEPFVIVLSEGPEFRVLPELTDRTFDDAAAELAGLGLNVTESPDRAFSETLAPGSVVSWQVIGNATLVAGQEILPGETIELTLSAGPEPRVVPSLAGLGLDDATARGAELQLAVVSGEGVFSDDVPEGLVVSQSPAEGASLERDGTITVQLSLGPDIVPLPDLDGLSFTDAQVLLDEAGFVIGRLLGTTEGTFVELTIAGEEIPPGTEFPRGTIVDVIFL